MVRYLSLLEIKMLHKVKFRFSLFLKKGALIRIGACIKNSPERGAVIIKRVLIGKKDTKSNHYCNLYKVRQSEHYMLSF